MKIVLLSDPHLDATDGTVAGLDPRRRLHTALLDIVGHNGDADLCIICGDLTEDGSVASYEQLAGMLRRFPIPVRLLMGNHDERSTFLSVFPETETDPHGFVQSVLDTPRGRLVFLDSLDTGRPGGRLCEHRLGWLEARLAEIPGQPVHIFLHHPPFAIGVSTLDSSRLNPTDAASLQALLKRHGNVRGIFAGHVHRAVFAEWGGLAAAALPSTNHQTALELGGARASLGTDRPSYGIALLSAEETVLHIKSFVPPS